MGVDLHHAEEELVKSAPIFSPIAERHMRLFSVQYYSMLGAKQGEEILCNYLEFIGDSDYWEEEVME